jgi:hypothetical protein
MYLAPLNYDRFFKKVFSDLNIAKRFLEDFFDVTIESIELLPNRYKITDDSTAVEFDYRCKMDGRYVIVDMQQWYKTDIVKRFYVYHCLNTALQIDGMPLKGFQTSEEKKKEAKDYDLLEPVITLIWLADDTLGVEEDYIAYRLTPENLTEYVQRQELWQNEKFLEIMEERMKMLALLDNKTKQMDFLAQNRLIYALQKNIIKNTKYRRYVAWFRFAEMSKNKNNKKEDFMEFSKDLIFAEVIRRLDQSTLTGEDFQYITDYEKFAKEFKQHEESIRRVALREGYAGGEEKGLKVGIEKGEKIGIEKGEKIGIEKGEKIGIEKGEKIGIEKGEKAKAEKIAIEMIREGENNDRIKRYTGLSDEEVDWLRDQNKPSDS